MTKAATSYIALKAMQTQAAVAASQREGLQTLLDTRHATPRLNFCFPRFDSLIGAYVLPKIYIYRYAA